MTDPAPNPLRDLAIRNPANAAHFMRIKPVSGRVSIRFAGETLALSADALRVLEVGRDLYDPVLYLPAADVRARLRAGGGRTRCPIKGESEYLDLHGSDGALRAAALAWSYDPTVPGAEALAGRIAFDPRQVEITETPPGAGG